MNTKVLFKSITKIDKALRSLTIQKKRERERNVEKKKQR